jgi:heparanase 1
MREISIRFTALVLGATMVAVVRANAIDIAVEPAQLPAIGKVDERFQSYNVESVEVTGGNFWAPYPKPGATPQAPATGPHGTEFATNAYQKREPIDLKDRHLRMLTRALGPAYMRVSGSWANSIYF